MNNKKNIILITSIFINIILFLVIWSFNVEVITHNNRRAIVTSNHMKELAEEAKKYLNTEKSDERKEVGTQLDIIYRRMIESHHGTISVYTPFLGGDQAFQRKNRELITFIFHPIWDRTFIHPDDREEGCNLKYGRELNANEIKFFSEVLKEFNDLEFTDLWTNRYSTLNIKQKREYINQVSELIAKVKELRDLYVPDLKF